MPLLQALAALQWAAILFFVLRLALFTAWRFMRRRIAESIDLCFTLKDCLCDRR